MRTEFYVRFANENDNILKTGQEFVVVLDLGWTVNKLKKRIVEQHGILLRVTSTSDFYLGLDGCVLHPSRTLVASGVKEGVSVDFYRRL